MADVDVHVVLPRIDRNTFEVVVASAHTTVRSLAIEIGRSGGVELRHGPFKPCHGAERDLQLHLILDDEASLNHSSCALLAHRDATGLLLLGESLSDQWWDVQPAAWLEEARLEMTRWRDGLAAGEIVFRHWKIDPEPHLVEGRIAARTTSDLTSLLRGAASSCDLHYCAALLIAQAAPLLAEDLARSLLSQLEEKPSSHTLPAHWNRVRDQAITVVDRRLDQISRLSDECKPGNQF